MEAIKPQEGKKHFLDRSLTAREIIFFAALAFCLSSFASPPLALFLGILLAQLTGHPYLHYNQKATQLLLKVSVVGLGFGMNVHTAVKAGKDGLLFTLASIVGTLVVGCLLGRLFKTNSKTSFLIAAGTAICGGSAIAALSPIIKAEEKQISIALGTVFILNAAALVLFPFAGQVLHLLPSQAGLWCALAIHDTSSVIGAAGKFGGQALEVATTVKLARALWIVPVSFLSTFLFKNKGANVRVPFFILFFLAAMCANTFLPAVQEYSQSITHLSITGLNVTLFLIGCGLSKEVLTTVGVRPVLQGLLLWIVVSASTIGAILLNVFQLN